VNYEHVPVIEEDTKKSAENERSQAKKKEDSPFFLKESLVISELKEANVEERKEEKGPN
jgi:hypothetical protein